MSGSSCVRYDRLYTEMCAQLGLIPDPKWTAGYKHIRSVVFYTSSIGATTILVEPPHEVPKIKRKSIPFTAQLDEFERREIKDGLIDFIHDNRFRDDQNVANEFFYLLALAFSKEQSIVSDIS